MGYEEIIHRIKSLVNPETVAGMARYGINPHNTYGVSMPVLRSMAKEIRKDHQLAEELWSSGIHEARILACLVDDPALVTEEQLEKWVSDFDSWDVCDQCCSNLFDKTRFAREKALRWSKRPEEFVKRAGFVLMAQMAVHNKRVEDRVFVEFLPIIKEEAADERNLVKKAVNWALRQIGKRNLNLNSLAIETAKEIQKLDSKTARWIASDALRELTSEAVKRKVGGGQK